MKLMKSVVNEKSYERGVLDQGKGVPKSSNPFRNMSSKFAIQKIYWDMGWDDGSKAK